MLPIGGRSFDELCQFGNMPWGASANFIIYI